MSGLLGLPVLVVFTSLVDPQPEIWKHLADTVLADYIVNSLLLAFSVGLGCLLLGGSLAWCVVRFEFWGRKTLQWVLVLPLAMPAYIIAYTYTGLLDFAGPLQSALREHFGWSYGEYWFPEIRSLSGAIAMLILVLYPYVYILARTAFAEQSKSLREASLSLGISSWRYFIQVALPMARPALLAGTALTMMEAFADYGTVQYFGVSTFTTGIFRTWFGLGNQIAASQLAALLCTFVLVLLLLERWSRNKVRYYQRGNVADTIPRIKLNPSAGLTLLLLCALVPLLGFFVPVYQLLIWALANSNGYISDDFWQLLWNSFFLAGVAAVLIVGLAIVFAYGKRLSRHPLMSIQIQTVSLGYAIPGTVIAVGVLLPLSWADHGINYLSETFYDTSVGLILSGTLVALLLAYTVRFLSVALQNVDSGLARITPSMDEAARSMGLSSPKVLFRVHIPIMRASIISALLLVFVDVLKELPATLILRPFNYNTLAVSAFQYASDERLVDAAAPALAIVAAGLIPVIMLSRALDKNREH
ncbi:iron ABC transporter permease [Aliiglaciecola sp. LCG003]|uniref:ABC transporter permease n=1 Tax=Aliiglaciecola sp. LCG003 TaxID=3053655 RepID=UPI002572917C|nr:iron ABC transporter permease [Aliiglaciecola sp. LCG003]WJG08124.1 iron ABC transporter permease [Aliiglaciecola sp. LCG003]